MKPTNNEPTSNFFRISHQITELEDFKTLTPSAKVLYLTLCQLRNRYQRKKSYFMRSERQLVKDTNMSKRSIVRAKQELINKRFIWYRNKPRGRARFHVFEFGDSNIFNEV